ncbi:hypothetical protein D3C81_850750 [compost metagenome]
MLQRFHRQVGGVGHVHMDRVHAVDVIARTAPAANGLQVDEMAVALAQAAGKHDRRA